jgi:L-threonylcarbamoyladenylate synthase
MQQYKTECLEIDPQKPSPALIEKAAGILRQGELVVFPTETVYGLGADAFQPEALAKIFTAKGRPLSDPLIVHIATLETLEILTAQLPETIDELAKMFWPGPLTLILPRGPQVPWIVTAGQESVAVRMPGHAVARALIAALGSPIAAPSANRFMHVSPTTAQHVQADLNGRVPLILDAGSCAVGVESTILDLTGELPTILRPGGVSLEALRRVLPTVQPPRKLINRSDEDGAQLAPGQLTMHYAPSIPFVLYDGSEEAMREALLVEIERRLAQGERVGVLVADADLPAFQKSAALVRSLGDAEQTAQVAAALFAELRVLEDAQVQVILCRNFPAQELGLAIRDRLGRAAGGKIIGV